ncbi:hypothetical protein ACFRAR_36060, partial [Kitasatospora sp. NPDC056651]
MRGTDLIGPDGPVDGGSDEEELRVLLHRAVPVLDAPDDRMDRVLARVERARRRRRAVALAAGLTAGLTAAVLAAAPALAPAPGRGTGLGPAASAQAPVSAAVSASASASATAPATARVTFPVFPEMAVDVPEGWQSRAAPAVDPQRRFGYLGTRPLGSPCAAASCTPSGPLLVGDAVLVFRLLDDQTLADKVAVTVPELTDSGLDESCAILGATRELVGVRAIVGADRKVVVEMTGCLRQPTDLTLHQVRQVFDSVRPAAASPPRGSPRRRPRSPRPGSARSPRRAGRTPTAPAAPARRAP